MPLCDRRRLPHAVRPDIELAVVKRLGRVMLRLIESRADLEHYVGPRPHATPRELEVAYLAVVEGLPNSAIARRLVISVKTVEAHRSHLREKLGLFDGGNVWQRLGAEYWRELGREEVANAVAGWQLVVGGAPDA